MRSIRHKFHILVQRARLDLGFTRGPFRFTLGQLFFAHAHVDRVVDGVDVNLITVLNESDRSTFESFLLSQTNERAKEGISEEEL